MKTALAALLVLVALVIAFLWAQPNGGPSETRISGDAAKRAADVSAMPANRAGPARWDASGRFRCSVDSPTFARTCGFRLVRNRTDASVHIWVRNLAKDKAEYRILQYANETFASNDDSKVSWERKGEQWWVNVDGKEFYMIPDGVLRAE